MFVTWSETSAGQSSRGEAGTRAIEHDDTTSARTVEAFTRTGQFVDITPQRDLTGRPRFVTATRERLTQ